jgi:glycosyltransferase involved in cell wall biosynthesis
VTYEALLQGVPVIATPNAGSVVRPGQDGYIVPLGETAAIVERLEELNENRELLARLSQGAMARRLELSVSGYAQRLLSALAARPAPSTPGPALTAAPPPPA